VCLASAAAATCLQKSRSGAVCVVPAHLALRPLPCHFPPCCCAVQRPPAEVQGPAADPSGEIAAGDGSPESPSSSPASLTKQHEAVKVRDGSGCSTCTTVTHFQQPLSTACTLKLFKTVHRTEFVVLCTGFTVLCIKCITRRPRVQAVVDVTHYRC
jgi:hypothetical protein